MRTLYTLDILNIDPTTSGHKNMNVPPLSYVFEMDLLLKFNVFQRN